MKIKINAFRGEVPIAAARLLPEGMGSTVVNAKLVSGNLDSFNDIGNPFQLAKNPIIDALWLMAGPQPTYWLQFAESEVGYGTSIDVSLGTIPGDMTYRSFITGLAGGPKQTNLYFATDPSQQGSNPTGAYPYVTFPLGIESPSLAPTAVGPSAPSGPAIEYDFAAQTSVNNANVNNASHGYVVGDILPTNQGTVPAGLHGALIHVDTVDTSGAITGITLKSGGFFTTGGGAPAVGATTGPGSISGAAGATLNLNLITSSFPFPGFNSYTVNNGAGYYIQWNVDGSNRWAAQTGQGDLAAANSETIFGLKTAPSFSFQGDFETDDNGGGEFTDLVMWLCGTYGGSNTITGPGVVLSKTDGLFTLYGAFNGTNGGAVSGSVVAQAAVAPAGNTMYRIRAVCTAQTASTTSGFSVVVSLALASTPTLIIATLNGFIPYMGESLGVGSNHRGNHNNGNDAAFENLLVSVSQPASQVTSESTSYVYTYVTQFGMPPNQITQESGPSDPSATVTFFLDGSNNPVTMTPVQISIPPAPAGLSIAFYNLYRLVQLADGSEVFEFVVQKGADIVNPVPYSDSKLDSVLGNPLQSTDWVPPPSNLQGILALPNGVMAGFFANTLCLSAQNFPFAWPVGNQLSTDTPIVAIAAIDTTVLVLTTGHPYTAWGNDPAAYSMSKETSNQGCVSKRSAATHKRLGVIYASGNGLCFYRGQGQLDLIRMPDGNPYFSVEQWQALKPASILGVVHDDRYWFWYDNGTVKGGYVLDLSPAGFGLVELDFHVTAAYVDPASDTLFFTPDFSVHPINGAAVGAALNVLSQWEGGSGTRPRSWERGDYLLPRPAAFSMARVRADDYADVHLLVSCESGIAFDGAVSGPGPFVIAPKVGVRWRVKLSGASTSNTVEVVERCEELAA